MNSSLSERRAQLEGLNGVKSNLAKLQLLMDLPPRLQACVEAKQYEEAVRHYRRAQRLLKAVGHVASFDSIRTEAAAIMQRLTQTLKAKLDDPALPLSELGSTTRLLLLLEGHEVRVRARARVRVRGRARVRARVSTTRLLLLLEGHEVCSLVITPSSSS